MTLGVFPAHRIKLPFLVERTAATTPCEELNGILLICGKLDLRCAPPTLRSRVYLISVVLAGLLAIPLPLKVVLE